MDLASAGPGRALKAAIVAMEHNDAYFPINLMHGFIGVLGTTSAFDT